MKDLAFRALKAREELSALYGREPTPEEIAGSIERDVREVREALDAVAEPLSLSEPAGDEAYGLMDKLADDSDEGWIDRIALEDALKGCTKRERRVIYLRYYKGRTQQETARELSVSQAQISRIERSASERLKKALI